MSNCWKSHATAHFILFFVKNCTRQVKTGKLCLVTRKADFVVSNQQCRPACASAQSDQHLCYSVIGNCYVLACYLENFNFHLVLVAQQARLSLGLLPRRCLTRAQRAVGSSLTGVTALCPLARHFNPNLVLVQPRKTRP